jgi:PTS system nitrogen regulatory IIA component
MHATDVLVPGGVVLGLRAKSKAEVLHELGSRLALSTRLDERLIREGLFDREDLGSTTIAPGIALPHAWIEGSTRVAGILMRFEQPVSWTDRAFDPVDLVVGIIGPAVAGLSAAAAMARALRRPGVAAAIRKAGDREKVFRMLAKEDAAQAALGR